MDPKTTVLIDLATLKPMDAEMTRDLVYLSERLDRGRKLDAVLQDLAARDVDISRAHRVMGVSIEIASDQHSLLGWRRIVLGAVLIVLLGVPAALPFIGGASGATPVWTARIVGAGVRHRRYAACPGSLSPDEEQGFEGFSSKPIGQLEDTVESKTVATAVPHGRVTGPVTVVGAKVFGTHRLGSAGGWDWDRLKFAGEGNTDTITLAFSTDGQRVNL